MENDYLKKQNTRLKCRPQAQLRTHNRESEKAEKKSLILDLNAALAGVIAAPYPENGSSAEKAKDSA